MSKEFYAKIDGYKSRLSEISHKINDYASNPTDKELAKKVDKLQKEFKNIQAELSNLSPQVDSLRKVARLEGLKHRANFISAKYQAISSNNFDLIHETNKDEQGYKKKLKSNAPAILNFEPFIALFANNRDRAFTEFATLPEKIQEEIAKKKPPIEDKQAIALAMLRYHEKAILSGFIYHSEKKDEAAAQAFSSLLPEKVMQGVKEQIRMMGKVDAKAQKVFNGEAWSGSIYAQAARTYKEKHDKKVSDTQTALDDLVTNLSTSAKKENAYHQFFQRVVPIWTNQSADKVVKITDGTFEQYCNKHSWMTTMGFSRHFTILADRAKIDLNQEAPRSSSSSGSSSSDAERKEAYLDQLSHEKHKTEAERITSEEFVNRKQALTQARDDLKRQVKISMSSNEFEIAEKLYVNALNAFNNCVATFNKKSSSSSSSSSSARADAEAKEKEAIKREADLLKLNGEARKAEMDYNSIVAFATFPADKAKLEALAQGLAGSRGVLINAIRKSNTIPVATAQAKYDEMKNAFNAFIASIHKAKMDQLDETTGKLKKDKKVVERGWEKLTSLEKIAAKQAFDAYERHRATLTAVTEGTNRAVTLDAAVTAYEAAKIELYDHFDYSNANKVIVADAGQVDALRQLFEALKAARQSFRTIDANKEQTKEAYIIAKNAFDERIRIIDEEACTRRTVQEQLNSAKKKFFNENVEGQLLQIFKTDISTKTKLLKAFRDYSRENHTDKATTEASVPYQTVSDLVNTMRIVKGWQ